VKCEKLIKKDMIDANAAIILLEKRPEKIFRLCKSGEIQSSKLYIFKRDYASSNNI